MHAPLTPSPCNWLLAQGRVEPAASRYQRTIPATLITLRQVDAHAEELAAIAHRAGQEAALEAALDAIVTKWVVGGVVLWGSRNMASTGRT